MNDDPVLIELEKTRRELWKESDGTLVGYARMVNRLGQEERERFLAELEREKVEGKARAEVHGEGGSEGEWTPVGEGAMVVCEGEGPVCCAKGEE